MVKRQIKIEALLGPSGILVGLLLSLISAKFLFFAIPTDLQRISTIVAAISDDKQVDIAVFGDSIGMEGFDGNLLREFGKSGINFCSTGQSLAESCLLQSQLQPVERVVQFVSIHALKSEMPLENQKANAYAMYGAEPNSLTIDTLADVVGRETLLPLTCSEPEKRFQSRWAIQQSADTFARLILRRDIDLEQASTDLLHPSSYRQRLPKDKFQRELKMTYVGIEDNPIRPINVGVLAAIVDLCRLHNQQLTLVASPIHPFGQEQLGVEEMEEFSSVLFSFRSDSVLVLDASRLLGDDEFTDSLHPSVAGAEKLTRYIIAESTK